MSDGIAPNGSSGSKRPENASPELLACVSFEPDDVGSTLQALTGHQPTVAVGGALGAAILLSQSGQVLRLAAGQRTIIVLGELFGASLQRLSSWSGSADLAQVALSLNGSFAAVTFDPAAARVSVITDRTNSRKIYWGRSGKRLWLLSSPAFWPGDRRLDPAGVAWYLTHGAIYGGRTLFADMRVLGGAAVHEFSAAGQSSSAYWQYDFEPSRRGRPERDLQRDLSDSLIEAVRRRTGDGRRLYLSLSAGYDASGVLGILSRLRLPQVRCISYSEGNAKDGSDEHVAGLMARAVGYEHRVVRSYLGDFSGHIAINAALGQGVTPACDEIDAWRKMRAEFEEAPSAIYAGDECLGWTDYRLTSGEDVLRSVQIAGTAPLMRLKDAWHARPFESAGAAVAEDTARLLSSCPPSPDPHDAKDFLYLHHRLSATIMQWRQRIVGSFLPVRNPLLDNDVLDTMRTVPGRLRRQKRLYRRTVTEMFPDIYRLPRARFATYHVPVAAELLRNRDDLMPAFFENNPLDELVDRRWFAQMLERMAGAPTARRSFGAAARSSILSAVRALGVKDSTRRWFRPSGGGGMTGPTLLRLYLILRRALSATPADGLGDVEWQPPQEATAVAPA